MTVSIVSTGTPIDVLTGGLRMGAVTLIYGPTGSGKTTLLLRICRTLAGEGFNIYYIDTESAVDREDVNGRVEHASSLKSQAEALKKVAKDAVDSEGKFFIAVDTITGHFHRQVLASPKQYRASVAGDLSGKLVAQLNILRSCVAARGLAVVTAHLKSPVADNFKMNVLRRIAKAWREGKYTPTATDYERYMAWDPVQWIGGQGLGMHTQYRFRIYVDEDKSRIIQVEKWPLIPNWCIRYIVESQTGDFKTLGDRFIMDKHTMSRLYSLEFRNILGEVIEVSEREGIRVEESTETGESIEESKESKKSRVKKKTEFKTPEIPSMEDLIEREKNEP